MSWQVRVPKRISKILKRFPAVDSQRIVLILKEMEFNPFDGDIAKISGEENLWRRRVGNYRLFYSVDNRLRIIEVKEINRRTSVTY